MEFRSIRQTSRIGGVNRNPEATEHGKVPVWNNDLGYFDYAAYVSGDLNSKLADGIVVKGNDSTGADFIWKLDTDKNPAWRKEEYLKSISRVGNTAALLMNSGATRNIELGALAWEDSI